MSEETYEGIPRGKIPWDPKIDYEKCAACGKCIDFCHTSAFRLEEKDGEKRTVVNPTDVSYSAEVVRTSVLQAQLLTPRKRKHRR